MQKDFIKWGIIAAFIGAEMFVIKFWFKRFAADTAERSNLNALINSLELSADKDNGMICLVSVALLFIAFVAPLAVMRLVIIAVVGKYFLVVL